MENRPLVLIEWEDSAQPIAGWRWLESLGELGIVRCQSVGWLIQDGPEVKVVAPNCGQYEGDPDYQVLGVIRIPARAIVRITSLSGTA